MIHIDTRINSLVIDPVNKTNPYVLPELSCIVYNMTKRYGLANTLCACVMGLSDDLVSGEFENIPVGELLEKVLTEVGEERLNKQIQYYPQSESEKVNKSEPEIDMFENDTLKISVRPTGNAKVDEAANKLVEGILKSLGIDLAETTGRKN